MKKKVFIVYSSDDTVNVENYFIKVLERDCDVECIYDEKDFVFGKEIVSNIAEAINACEKIFVILTASSVEKNWVKYEMLQALEKSQRTRRLCVTVFLFDVARAALEGQLFGVLSNAMLVTVNTNKDDWQQRLRQDMARKLTEDRPMQGINIAANLSVGQAWSHFTGYGRIVLPLLKQRIEGSGWYRQHGDRFPLVEFNLIPHSARPVRALNELDNRIKFQGNLEEIIACRGSFGDRPYKVPVYSICDTDGTEYYCVAQIPNTLSILSKLEQQEAGSPGLRLSPGERSLQVARFMFTYNRLVNHPRSPECNNMLVLLPYKEENEKAGDVLLKAIKKRLNHSQVPMDDRVLDSCCRELRDSASSSACEKCVCDAEFNRNVYIVCVESCTEDVQTAYQLESFLKEHGFKVWDSFGSHFMVLSEAMKRCKWVIFVMSKTSLKDKEFPILHFKFRMSIAKCVEQNEVRVIPLADGVGEDDISDDLRAVTYLSKQEPRYKDKLLQILNGGSILMECKVPFNDVYQGLAWAYVLNYLNVTLDDRSQQFDLIQQNNPHCRVYRKMFIIIPSSCATRALGALDTDERGRLIDPNFQQMQDIHYKSENVGGVIGRHYQLVTYKINTQKQAYIVAVEYPNAVLCLQEMSQLEPLSGLSPRLLADEAWRFKELVHNIIHTHGTGPRSTRLADKATLLYYDDTKWAVSDAMLDVLEQESWSREPAT